MEDNELYHHGVQGMKWGFRRYQNEDGSLTDLGRQHYGYGLKEKVRSIKEAHHKKAIAKKREKALKKARKARAAKEEFNKAKKKALETGTADEVAKYINSLSPEEKQAAISRLRLDRDLNQLASDAARVKAEEAAKKSKWNKITGISKKAGEAATSVENWSKLYNASAKVINAFSDSELSLIGEKGNTDPNYEQTRRFAENIIKGMSNKSVKELSETDYEKLVKRASQISSLEQYAKKGTIKKN
jgi:hypothetical protein